MKTVAAVLFFCISAPIWYYLLYQILCRVNASELMFFLFWVYVPVGIFSQLIAKMIEGSQK